MPNPNYGEPSWPDVFSPAIANQIVTGVPGLTRDRVFSSAYNDEIHMEFPPGDKFVALFFPEFPVDQPGVSGGGIFTTGFDSHLEVRIFIRLEADIEGRSTQWLEDQAFGAYKFIQAVLVTIQMYIGPIAVSGLSHFKRPMRLMPGFRIERKNLNKESRWNVAKATFEVAFVGDFPQADYTTL
jgi:hypothetical protein